MTNGLVKFHKVFFELRFIDDNGNDEPIELERAMAFKQIPEYSEVEEELERFYAGINGFNRDRVKVNVLSIDAIGEAV